LLTVTDAKFKLPGTTVKSSGLEDATPVPFRVTTEGELAAVLVIVKLPLAAPDAVGAKVTFTVMLLPAVSVIGKVLPTDANGAETPMLLTVIDPELLFETNIG
jgi:hypothetical protein